MVAVEHKAIHVRHLAIEAHASLQLAHLLHSAHILTLSNDGRLLVGTHRLHLYMKLALFNSGHLALECTREIGTLLYIHYLLSIILLLDQTADSIAVHTTEAAMLLAAIAKFLLQHAYQSRIKLAVHQQDTVTIILGFLDIGVLANSVVGVEINEVTVLVGLIVLDEALIFLQCVILALAVL